MADLSVSATPFHGDRDRRHGGRLLWRRTVYRIDLGYIAVLQRDTLTFALTPVWNFYGNDLNDPDAGCRPLLTVHAVDGTVIDLEYGY